MKSKEGYYRKWGRVVRVDSIDIATPLRYFYSRSVQVLGEVTDRGIRQNGNERMVIYL